MLNSEKLETITVPDRVHNFSAGPSGLPLSVLEKARAEFLSFQDAGASVMEISHRSAAFDRVISGVKKNVRTLLKVPDDYDVLLLQGGASLQFSMVPMNLLRENGSAQVINTGVWTKKAIKEFKKQGVVEVLASSEEEKFSYIPRVSESQLNPDASFFYVTSNNTIAGTQYKLFPDTKAVPLVADMSSDIFSRELDIRQFGVIFAGAQKNIGPSGLALVIIRKDLLARSSEQLPSMLSYKVQSEGESMYNTPPTFGIYMVGLVLEWLLDLGGVSEIEKRNKRKAQKLYDYIDQSERFQCPVAVADRSDMNVVFRLDNNEALEKQFVKEAESNGLHGLKGHRLVGGLRASIYNACPEESVDALIQFMKDFEKKLV